MSDNASLKWRVFEYQRKKDAYELCLKISKDPSKIGHMTVQYELARDRLLEKVLEEYG